MGEELVPVLLAQEWDTLSAEAAAAVDEAGSEVCLAEENRLVDKYPCLSPYQNTKTQSTTGRGQVPLPV